VRVLIDVVREAFQQCRRRPLAVVLALATAGVEVVISYALLATPAGVQALGLVAVSVAYFLVSLFLIPYLADGLQDQPPPARTAWSAAIVAAAPALRVMLVGFAYLMLAVLVAGLFAGVGSSDADPAEQIPRLLLGSVPLVAFAIAFLAVALQRVVIGGERRAFLAVAFAHKVAVAHFPVCLAIGLLFSAQVAIAGRDLGWAAIVAAAAAIGLLRAWVPAMANALYLRTRATIALEQKPTNQ
jgi:hypothetical protein